MAQLVFQLPACFVRWTQCGRKFTVSWETVNQPVSSGLGPGGAGHHADVNCQCPASGKTIFLTKNTVYYQIKIIEILPVPPYLSSFHICSTGHLFIINLKLFKLCKHMHQISLEISLKISLHFNFFTWCENLTFTSISWIKSWQIMTEMIPILWKILKMKQVKFGEMD